MVTNPKIRTGIILTVLLIGIVGGVYLILKGAGILPSRAAENVNYNFQPSTTQASQGQEFTVELLANTGTTHSGYVETTVTFDTSKLTLSAEPVIQSPLNRRIFVGTMSQANSNGRLSLVLGLEPTLKNNAPAGNFKLASLKFTPKTSTSSQTSISVDTGSSSTISMAMGRMQQSVSSLTINLNGGGTSTPTATPKPTTTPTPVPPTTPPSIPPIGETKGIWLSKEEIMALPASGAAWNNVLSEANSSWGSANLGDNNATHDVKTLAGALVAVRNNDNSMRNKVISGLQSAMNSNLSRTLELARGLQSYVIAADIIGYRTSEFEAWVKKMLEDTSISGRVGGGLYNNALKDSTNWGGHERASSVAAARYLNDTTKLTELAKAQREFIGENVSPKRMTYDNTNWHADPNNKAGVNRKGSTIQGHDVSGVLPEDWRRAAEFQWPPQRSNYMWEGMEGFVVAAAELHRAGLVPFSAGDNAVVRAVDILFRANITPASHDLWMVYLVNHYAGTNYPASGSGDAGRGMGYTDWTHQ